MNVVICYYQINCYQTTLHQCLVLVKNGINSLFRNAFLQELTGCKFKNKC